MDASYSIRSAAEPELQHRLRALFLAKWDCLDPFEGTTPGFAVPPPLVALLGPQLVGGLAFTSSTLPGSLESGLWINALLVVPEHRGQGLATQLLRHAQAAAIHAGADALYVYTDIPALYEKLGWTIIQRADGHAVLTARLRV